MKNRRPEDEKIPEERKLSPRNFHHLNSVIVTTLIVEKIYGAIKSWEVAIECAQPVFECFKPSLDVVALPATLEKV